MTLSKLIEKTTKILNEVYESKIHNDKFNEKNIKNNRNILLFRYNAFNLMIYRSDKMKKIVTVSTFLLLTLTACGQQQQVSKPTVTNEKPVIQNVKKTDNQNTVPSQKSNESQKSVATKPSASFNSYEGQYSDGQATAFSLDFLDGKVGRKALVNGLSAVYDNGNRLVDGGSYVVTFGENGKASFHYGNSREGEGNAELVLHDGKATLTFTHEKDSFDGFDFYKGSHDFTAEPKVSLAGAFKTYAESDKKQIESKAGIAADATFPVSEEPNAVMSVDKDHKLFAWKVTKNGEDGTKQQVYFFLNDKFLGTDTKKPQKRILSIDTSNIDGNNSFSVEYTGDVQNGMDDIFVEYSYVNGKIVPDENFNKVFK